MKIESRITNFDTLQQNLRPWLGGRSPRGGRIYTKPKHIWPCDDPALWINDVRCTDAADTDNYMCSSASTKRQSIKITMDVEATTDWCRIQRDLGGGGGIDLDNSNIVVRFYIYESSGTTSWENIKFIQIQFLDDTGNDWAKFKIFENTSPLAHPGWHTWTGHPGTYISRSNPVVWTDIRQIEIRIYTKSSNNQGAIITLDEIAFIPKLTTPLMMLRFDDGFDEHYEVATYLASKGLVGCFSIMGSGTYGIGQANHLTWDQCRRMQEMGHLIINHTYSDMNWALHTNEEMAQDLIRMSHKMCEEGLGAGSRIYVSTQGLWPENAEDAISKAVDFVWLLQNCGEGITRYITAEPIWNPFIMHGRSFGAIIRTDAIAYGAVGTSVWHHVGEGTGPVWAAFETDIENIVTDRDAGSIAVVTPIDILNGIY